MRYWKRLNSDGSTRTVESYSHDLDIEGGTEISEQEFNAFLASLPAIKPESVRDYGTEIDKLKVRIEKMELKGE